MIRILFFGATAELIGKRQIELDEGGSSKAKEIFSQILETYPALTSHRLLYSINQQYATGEEIVKDGDELSVFTAVSGG